MLVDAEEPSPVAAPWAGPLLALGARLARWSPSESWQMVVAVTVPARDYAALLIGLSWGFLRLPGGFLPVDDQGFITTDVQTPADSSYARTEAAVEKTARAAEKHGKWWGIPVADADGARKRMDRGATFFVCGSMWGFAYQGFTRFRESFADLLDLG